MRRLPHILVALAAVGLVAGQRAPRIKIGDTVVVTVESAPVTVRRKTVKRLEEGDTFKVKKMNRNAVAHYLNVNGKKQLGWVSRSAVQRATRRVRDKGEDKRSGTDTKDQGPQFKPGALLKTTTENAPLRLPGRVVGRLPKGTRFRVVRVNPREVYGFAEIGRQPQPGWLFKDVFLSEETETDGKGGNRDKKQIKRPIKKGDTVVVTTSDAKLQRRDRKLLARLDEGTTFKVEKVSKNEVAGYVNVDGKRHAGWVDKGDVRLKSAAGDEDDHADPLRGVWKVVSSEYDGKENEAEIGVRYRFRDGTLQITDQQNRTTRSKYKFDSSDDPMMIDLTAASSAGASSSAGKRQMGIIKLEDETLTICLASPRPTEFTSEPGDETYLRVLERVKSRAR